MRSNTSSSFFFFFNDTATTEIYTLSLHDALPIYALPDPAVQPGSDYRCRRVAADRAARLRRVGRGPRVTPDSSDNRDPLTFEVQDEVRVSARLELPARARACYVLAHGAGAGMEHPFLSAAARELGALGIATLRYQFPYMQRHSRRPDPPPVCHATVRAAVAAAVRLAPALPLFAGGPSFRGRLTPPAPALAPLPGGRRLALLGLPPHPAGP